ncbi:MAG: hypothetical protein R2814_18190 [Flavobacteriaceae bacterium]
MTLAFEKRKPGAVVHERFAYMLTSDNFVLETFGKLCSIRESCKYDEVAKDR